MKYLLTVEPEFLKAELFHYDSVEDARAFLHAVFWASLQHLRANVLINVRAGKPLFSSASDEIFPFVRRLAWYRTNRIAMTGNVQAAGLEDNAMEARADKQGIRLRGFADETLALKWFRDRRNSERRQAMIRLRAKSSRPGQQSVRDEDVDNRREARDRRRGLPDIRFTSALSRL